MVPKDQWCDGRHTPEEIAAAQSQRRGLSGLFKR